MDIYAIANYSKMIKLLILPRLLFNMTQEEDSFKNTLEISRNKLKMLFSFHLDSIADSLILENEASIPCPLKHGCLEYTKNPNKFGNKE